MKPKIIEQYMNKVYSEIDLSVLEKDFFKFFDLKYHKLSYEKYFKLSYLAHVCDLWLDDSFNNLTEYKIAIILKLFDIDLNGEESEDLEGVLDEIFNQNK